MFRFTTPCSNSVLRIAGSGNNVVWSSVAPLYAVISVPNIPTAAPKKKKGFFGGSKAKAAAAVGLGMWVWRMVGDALAQTVKRSFRAVGLQPPVGSAMMSAGQAWRSQAGRSCLIAYAA